MRPLDYRLLTLVSFSLLILALGLLDEVVNPALLYRRELIEAGEVWRLWSGHLVHLGAVHTLLNLAGLWLIAVLVGDAFSARTWVVTFILLCLFTSLCLYVFSSNVAYYAGLSGVLHGLLIVGLTPGLWRLQPVPTILTVAVVAKLIYEQLVPASQAGTAALIAAPVVAIAHIYGAIGGLLLGAGIMIRANIKRED